MNDHDKQIAADDAKNNRNMWVLIVIACGILAFLKMG
jgi:hypothetical protein